MGEEHSPSAVEEERQGYRVARAANSEMTTGEEAVLPRAVTKISSARLPRRGARALGWRGQIAATSPGVPVKRFR
jgi:hypothetical protein